mmetsp:Transcript_27170/g.68945  ORF Transcript_27170/g.68945 Transcript_27170/m.68945 type:complete len:259 (-) Transcript_27170:2683-3459(-)
MRHGGGVVAVGGKGRPRDHVGGEGGVEDVCDGPQADKDGVGADLSKHEVARRDARADEGGAVFEGPPRGRRGVAADHVGVPPVGAVVAEAVPRLHVNGREGPRRHQLVDAVGGEGALCLVDDRGRHLDLKGGVDNLVALVGHLQAVGPADGRQGGQGSVDKARDPAPASGGLVNLGREQDVGAVGAGQSGLVIVLGVDLRELVAVRVARQHREGDDDPRDHTAEALHVCDGALRVENEGEDVDDEGGGGDGGVPPRHV